MKTLKQLLSEATFKYYYHVTFKKNVSKIKSKGLNPLQTSNWAKGDGKRYNQQGGVFAFQHPEDAWKWAFKMNWDFKKPISIIRIKKSKNWTKDPSSDITLQMGKGDALQSISAIPKSDIVDSHDFDDFGTPAKLGVSQQEWIDGIVKQLSENVLNELFDKPVEYKKTTDSYGVVRYSFYAGEYLYVVEFSYRELGNYGVEEPFWEISFVNVQANDAAFGYGISNTGNEIQVFSTVVNIMKEFIKNKKPDALLFSAKEPSRKKLYDSMVRKLAKNFTVTKLKHRYHLKAK